MKRILPVVISLPLFFFFASPTFASTLNLSPGSGTIPQGGALSVRVTLNTGGEGVNGVSAYLSYSAGTVDATVSCGGAFAIGAECSAGGGSIRISRGSINAVSGNVTVGTITLKGKTQGSATVSFVGGSAAPRASDSSDSLNLGGSSGGTYTVGPPSAQAPKQPAVTGGPQQGTAGPKISDVKITDVTNKGASISWKTDILSDGAVEYGLEEGKYFLSSIDENLAAEHTIKLEGPLITPGAKLHLRVVSKDAKDNKSEGGDLVLKLLGYQVQLTLLDEKGKPLREVEVTLFSDPQKDFTDENGVVTFKNVTPGRHVVIAKSGFLERSSQIDVLDSPDNQSFSLTLKGLGKPVIQPLHLLIVSYAVIIVSIIIAYIMLRRHKSISVF